MGHTTSEAAVGLITMAGCFFVLLAFWQLGGPASVAAVVSIWAGVYAMTRVNFGGGGVER